MPGSVAEAARSQPCAAAQARRARTSAHWSPRPRDAGSTPAPESQATPPSAEESATPTGLPFSSASQGTLPSACAMQRSASRCASDWVGAPRKAREKSSTQVAASSGVATRTTEPGSVHRGGAHPDLEEAFQLVAPPPQLLGEGRVGEGGHLDAHRSAAQAQVRLDPVHVLLADRHADADAHRGREGGAGAVGYGQPSRHLDGGRPRSARRSRSFQLERVGPLDPAGRRGVVRGMGHARGLSGYGRTPSSWTTRVAPETWLATQST